MIVHKHDIDTAARLAAKERFMNESWLDDRTLRARMAWLDIRPGDPRVMPILRAVHATAATVREYKIHYRHTRFGRTMRLQHRLPPWPAKYAGTPVINAAQMLLVTERTDYIHLTEQTRPITGTSYRLGHNRRADMKACRKFLEEVQSKFIHETVWPDELVCIESFVRLGLTPEELLKAETALIHLMSRYRHEKGLTWYLMPTYGSRSRRLHTLTMGDFLNITRFLQPNYGDTDMEFLMTLADRLRPRLAT